MAEYRGRLPLFHIDPYRLADAADALEGGLIDERQREGVTLVEWPERLGDALPAARLDVRIDGIGDDPRVDHARRGLGRLPPLPGGRGVTHDGRRHAILAIDTATTRVVIATGTPEGVADGLSTWTAGYRHGETLLPSIGRFLGEQNIRRSRLVGIVVGTGPGAFTGLRVGIATAKGLAHGLGIPLVGVSTAEALIEAFEAADGADGAAGRPSCCCRPARGPARGPCRYPARAAPRRGGTRPRPGRAPRGRRSRGPRPRGRAGPRRDGPRRPRPGAPARRRGQTRRAPAAAQPAPAAPLRARDPRPRLRDPPARRPRDERDRRMVARPPVRVVIEPMRLEDLPAVHAIEQASFTSPWPPHAYQSELESNRLAHYLVARVGDAVAGYGGMWLMVDEAHITTFAVHPAWRRQRIGERLLIAFLDVAVERGAHEATLEVRLSNLPARKLYEKYGFRPVGLRPRYYSDDNEDALIMTTEPLAEPGMRARIERLRAALDEAPAPTDPTTDRPTSRAPEDAA